MEKVKKNLKKENAKIKIIGVGGAGCNAVNRMAEDKTISGVEYVVINTDLQVLEKSKAQTVLIGSKTTRGLGAGANPDIGRKAAEENKEEIRQAVDGSDLVFITAGMGGGTGTGAAPVVASICKELDILTIGVVTLPFAFEGRKRMKQARKGRKEVFEYCDTLITIPNDKILESLDEKEAKELTTVAAFERADSVLAKSAIGISDLINRPGHINLDYADIRTAVKVGGSALMGMGEAKGENAALKAASQAMTNPLLTHGIAGAKGVVMNFTGSSKLSFMEVSKAAAEIEQFADEDAEILYGQVITEDPDWEEDKVLVTIVATGFIDELTAEQQSPVQQSTDWYNSSSTPTQEHREEEITIPSFNQNRTTHNSYNAPQERRDVQPERERVTLSSVEKDINYNIPEFLRVNK